MNPEWLPADGWPRFVVDAVWQSMVVAMIALCAIHTVARRPSTRALLSVIGIVLAVALPIASAGARLAGWGILSSAAATEKVSDKPVAIQRPDIAGGLVHANSIAAAPPTDTTSAAVSDVSHSPRLGSTRPEAPRSNDEIHRGPSAAMIFLTIWAGLSVVMLIRLVRGVWRTMRILKEATPCSDLNLVSAVRDAAQRIGIDTPNVCFSSGVSSPTVFALGRGVVLLPTRNVPAPDRNFWLAVFCHELGHVRRRDGWNRVAIEAALVLLPWQPFAWLLRREFLHYSEEACDDWAVATGADPVALASILTDFVPIISRPHLGAAIMTTDAKTRILRLLALRETPRPRTPRMQLAAIVVAAMIAGASVALAQRGSEGKPEAKANQAKAATNDTVGESSTADEKLAPSDEVEVHTLRLLPKAPFRIRPLDVILVDVQGELADEEIDSVLFAVDPDGHINLGPSYGKVKVSGLSLDEARDAVKTQLRRVLSDPQVSITLAESASVQQVTGKRRIGLDGNLNLNTFGEVHVSGLTLDEAEKAVEKKLSAHFDKPSISLTVRPEHKSAYVLEPPDVVEIETHRLLPKGPQRIEKLDTLQIEASGTFEDAPIKGKFAVDADGEVTLGAMYGRVAIAGLTVKEATKAIDNKLREILRDPQVALSITSTPKVSSVAGMHTIGPDGHVNLGAFGTVYVSGLTLDDARRAIEKNLSEHFDKPSIALDIHEYNSKVYYVIVESEVTGDNISRYPLTGNDHVLDAIAQQSDLLIRKDTKIWIARPVGDKFEVLNIDWRKLTSGEMSSRRFRLIPGDRIFVSGASWKSVAEPTKGKRS